MREIERWLRAPRARSQVDAAAQTGQLLRGNFALFLIMTFVRERTYKFKMLEYFDAGH